MIWGADGRKLSKRHGATSVEAFHDEGFLPEALLNYLALLGWSLDGETTIVSSEILKTHFSLDRISKSPAIFDFEKLEWMNGVYIREMGPDAFVARMLPWIEEAGLASAGDLETRHEWLLALAPLVSERIKRMTEIVPMVRFLFVKDVVIDPAAAESTLAKEGAGLALNTIHDTLASLDEWTPETDRGGTADGSRGAEYEAQAGVSGRLGWRSAGATVSLPLFESIALLGREGALARLKAAAVDRHALMVPG